MVMVDRDRRYTEANPRARLTFRLSLAEFRALRVGDLTPPALLPLLEPTWERLLWTGSMAGLWAVEGPDGGHFDIVFRLGRSRGVLHGAAHVMAFTHKAGCRRSGTQGSAERMTKPPQAPSAPTPRELTTCCGSPRKGSTGRRWRLNSK